MPENLLHRFHLTALFIHIYLAPSSLLELSHALPRIGLDASIAFTRNMEPLNGRTGLVQLRLKTGLRAALPAAGSPHIPRGPDVASSQMSYPDFFSTKSRFLLNQPIFSKKLNPLIKLEQS